MKVLIADDELRLRKVVSLHLKKSGFEVVEAGNGQQAVELAQEIKPDVIVLDVMMPEKQDLRPVPSSKAWMSLSPPPLSYCSRLWQSLRTCVKGGRRQELMHTSQNLSALKNS